MVTSSYTPSKQAGNGVTVAFSGSFKILAATDLVVSKLDANGNSSGTLILGTDYTVTFDPIAETWTVTFTTAPVSGGFAVIARASNVSQQTSLPRESAVPAKTVETMVDKLTLLVQEAQANAAPPPPAYAQGTFAQRPASYPILTMYYSTDRDSLDIYVPASAKWRTIG